MHMHVRYIARHGLRDPEHVDAPSACGVPRAICTTRTTGGFGGEVPARLLHSEGCPELAEASADDMPFSGMEARWSLSPETEYLTNHKVVRRSRTTSSK